MSVIASIAYYDGQFHFIHGGRRVENPYQDEPARSAWFQGFDEASEVAP